jgi:hypothetical protein
VLSRWWQRLSGWWRRPTEHNALFFGTTGCTWPASCPDVGALDEYFAALATGKETLAHDKETHEGLAAFGRAWWAGLPSVN